YHEGSHPLMYTGGNHVSPARIIRMDRSCVNPHAAPQCAPSTRAGAVELWDCPHPVVWTPDGRHLSGPADAPEGRYRRTAAVRMVLPDGAQSGGPTPDDGRHDVFHALAALGGGLVGQYTDGAGPRRDELGGPL